MLPGDALVPLLGVAIIVRFLDLAVGISRHQEALIGVDVELAGPARDLVAVAIEHAALAVVPFGARGRRGGAAVLAFVGLESGDGARVFQRHIPARAHVVVKR